MADRYITASLLPYLNHQRGFFIEIGDADPLSADPQSISPLPVIRDSDPLSRIFKAQVSTQAKSDIQSLFLLVQKDQYTVNQDSLWPLKNTDVADAWQRALAFYSSGSDSPKPFLLKEQMGESGQLLPMTSLFYCRSRQIYFHPPCPFCAQPLQLCVDDVLLETNDLQPYSTSLSRYLYCASDCQQADKSLFYVPSHSANNQKPLRDLNQLLEGYGQGLIENTLGDSFPCTACDDKSACYGTEWQAKSRMVPFSFYPFFMLMFPAATMAAIDFLPLISGASLKTLEQRDDSRHDPGRSYCLSSFAERFPENQYLLFDDHDKAFLEILYLKLSFLSELIKSCFPDIGNARFPDLGLSIDDIWIRVAEQNSLLPLLWNFKVESLGIGSGVRVMPTFPKHSPSNALHFAGSVWFYTLLVNQTQNREMVFEGIGNLLEELLKRDLTFIDGQMHTAEFKFLRPENIFWDPAGKKIDAAWVSLWEQSIELGILFLKESIGREKGWSANKFSKMLHSLRSHVKKMLFQDTETHVSISQKISGNKNEVNGILSNILEKWRAIHQAENQQEKTALASSPTQHEPSDEKVDAQEEDTDIYETVIISADKFQKNDLTHLQTNTGSDATASAPSDLSALNGTKERAVSEEVDSLETIIVPAGASDRDVSQPFDIDKDLPETMIFSKPAKSDSQSPFDRRVMSGREEPHDLTAHKKKTADEFRPGKMDAGNPDEDDLLDKTIIQHSPKKV